MPHAYHFTWNHINTCDTSGINQHRESRYCKKTSDEVGDAAGVKTRLLSAAEAGVGSTVLWAYGFRVDKEPSGWYLCVTVVVKDGFVKD